VAELDLERLRLALMTGAVPARETALLLLERYDEARQRVEDLEVLAEIHLTQIHDQQQRAGRLEKTRDGVVSRCTHAIADAYMERDRENQRADRLEKALVDVRGLFTVDRWWTGDRARYVVRLIDEAIAATGGQPLIDADAYHAPLAEQFRKRRQVPETTESGFEPEEEKR
jgi:hypothetical protein